MEEQNSISDQLFNLTTRIITFDQDNYQSNILKEVSKIFKFKAALYLNTVSFDALSCSNIELFNNDINEDEINCFLNNELYSWHIKSGPYIGTFEDFSVIGVSFQQQTWGIFLSDKLPIQKDIIALNTFAMSVRIWFDYPYMFYSTEAPININIQSEKKYASLQLLYSIAEWEWEIDSNNCIISDSFLAFFDNAIIKPTYSISDLHDLIGENNTKRFKECINKVIQNGYQVLEEFKCLLSDKKTVQQIQILFDPLYQESNLQSITGYCRDMGRTNLSEKNSLKWYDSEWLHDLNLIPLEWISHVNGECDIVFSQDHCKKLKEDPKTLVEELKNHLMVLSKENKFDSSINIKIQLPFSKYQYQLIAAKSNLDSLLWRGVIILLNENKPGKSNSKIIESLDQYSQKCIFQLYKFLSAEKSMADYIPIIKFLVGLSRHSAQEYSFKDFLSQLEEAAYSYHKNITIKNNIVENFRVPNAQWVISLVTFIMNYFHLQHSQLLIECSEPKIIKSQNSRIISANHLLEIVITTTNDPKIEEIINLFFQLALMNSGLDICFSSNNFEWNCTIYSEVRGAEQPLIINSQSISKVNQDERFNKTILIVDDDKYNTQTIEILLQSNGFRTVTANNGKKGLVTIEKVTIIDLIILDIKMPVMDGLEFIMKIKNMEKFDKIPIIVISANITQDIIKRLSYFNITNIFEKPFDIDEIISQINSVLGIKSKKEKVGLFQNN